MSQIIYGNVCKAEVFVLREDIFPTKVRQHVATVLLLLSDAEISHSECRLDEARGI